MSNQPNTPGAFAIRAILAIVVGVATGLFLANNPYLGILVQLGIVTVAAGLFLALLFWKR